jgi:hypothetical protein
MIRLNHYRRVDVQNLQVGDVIRSKVLYQSRTGMIVRIKFRGRIESIMSEAVPAGQHPSFVEGRLREEHGIVQSFKFANRDRVDRRLENDSERAPRTVSPVRAVGQQTHDTEIAN